MSQEKPSVELPDGSGGTVYIRQNRNDVLIITHRYAEGGRDRLTLDPDLFQRIADGIRELTHPETPEHVHEEWTECTHKDGQCCSACHIDEDAGPES